MEFTISNLGTDDWRCDSGTASVRGNAKFILIYLASRLGVPVELIPTGEAKHYTGDNQFSDEMHQSFDERLRSIFEPPNAVNPLQEANDARRERLIAERNADGRHPIG